MKIVIDNQSSASSRKALRILRNVLKSLTRSKELDGILSGDLQSTEFEEYVRMDISGAGGNVLRVVMSDPTW